MRRDLMRAVRELWRTFGGAFDYRPERHYMRGPGPKCHAKRAGLMAQTAAAGLGAISPICPDKRATPSFRLAQRRRPPPNSAAQRPRTCIARACRFRFAAGGGVREVADVAVRCAILDDYQNVALTTGRLVEGEGRCRDQGLQRASRSGGERRRGTRGVCHCLRDARAHGVPARGHRGAAGAQTSNHNRNAQCLDRPRSGAGAQTLVVCGTPSFGNATAAIATGLMLDLARHIWCYEHARLKAGAPWRDHDRP